MASLNLNLSRKDADNEPNFHRAHNQIVTYSDKRFLFRDVALVYLLKDNQMSFAETFHHQT